MDKFKEALLNKMETLHIKLYYKNHYDKTEESIIERLKDTIRYEQLKEVIRMNPAWDKADIGRELGERIRKKTSLY